MYCKNCGSQINDGSLFCPVCGARSEEQPVQPSAPAYEAPEPLTNPEPKKRGLSKGALIGIIAGGAALLIALVLVLALTIGTRSWQATVNQLIDAELDMDFKKMVDLVFPDELLNAYLDEQDMTKEEFDEMIEEQQEEIDERKEENPDEYEEYRDSFSFEIVDHENLSKKEIRKLNEKYDEKFETGKNYISDAMTVTLEVSMDDEDPEEIELTLIKVGRKWYLDTSSNSINFDFGL